MENLMWYVIINYLEYKFYSTSKNDKSTLTVKELMEVTTFQNNIGTYQQCHQ